jgi:hypothetical protein
MKRTRVSTLVLLVIIGGLMGGLVEVALAASGRAIIIPPLTLPIALAAIGVIIILLAIPIRRLTKGKTKAPIDPYYALRVVMLAKACSISGSLVVGLSIGMIIYLLTRLALPGVGSIGLAIASLVGAAILLAAGLIAEFMCTIPPSDPDDDSGKKPIRVRP